MNYNRFVAGVLALLLLGSCKYKELSYVEANATGVRVAFDWTAAPEAAPEGMRVVFYPLSGAAPLVENLAGSQGGAVDVPPGRYRVVCFNNDTEAVRWRGEQTFETLEAYTREAEIVENIPGAGEVPRAEEAQTEPVVLAPDRMWRDQRGEVEVKPGTQEQVIDLHPVPATRHVVYELTGVKHAQHITMIRGSLSGVSGSYFMGTGACASTIATIPFDGKVDATDPGKITGEFDYFGCGDRGEKHIFTIYCWSPGGNVKASFDVTEQLHATAPQASHVRLEVAGDIDIPESVGNGAGFQPGVDAWDDQQTDLDM